MRIAQQVSTMDQLESYFVKHIVTFYVAKSFAIL